MSTRGAKAGIQEGENTGKAILTVDIGRKNNFNPGRINEFKTNS